MDLSTQIAMDLLSIRAVFFRPEEPFTWASGIKSPVYCDNRLTLTAPAVRNDVENGLVQLIRAHYPEAEVLVYDNYPNAYEAVANGRLDAYIYSRFQMALAMESGTSGVRLLEENYSVNTVAAGLSPVSPIPALPERFNAFLSELRADGTLDDMYLRWVIRTEDTMPEIAPPAHSTYRLRVGTTGTVLPYSYYAGTELRGYDIELAYRFAAWLGAVDKGQMEAAYALGYTENRAFFRVVLPQALPHFFPAYKGEIDR